MKLLDKVTLWCFPYGFSWWAKGEIEKTKKLEEEIELWWAKLSYQGKNEIAENLGYVDPNEMWESLEFGIKLDVFNEENSYRKVFV